MPADIFTVALTGGIASGKSSVAERFAARGISVIDADLLAREVVAPGEPALAGIVARFGAGVLGADGSLDRRRLRDIVFADEGARRDLEAILHPAIRASMDARRTACAAAGEIYCLCAIPLLVETDQQRRFDRVLVVDLDRQTQIERLLARDAGDRQQAEAILASQASREQRLAAADDTIDNRGPPQALEAQVAALHHRYLKLAAALRQAPRQPGGGA